MQVMQVFAKITNASGSDSADMTLGPTQQPQQKVEKIGTQLSLQFAGFKSEYFN